MLGLSGWIIRARQLTAEPDTNMASWRVGSYHAAPVGMPIKGARAPMKSYTDLRVEAEDMALAGDLQCIRRPVPDACSFEVMRCAVQAQQLLLVCRVPMQAQVDSRLQLAPCMTTTPCSAVPTERSVGMHGWPCHNLVHIQL